MRFHKRILLARPSAALTVALGGQTPKIPYQRDLQLTWAASLAREPDWETIVTLERLDSAEARIRISWNRGAKRQWQHFERALSTRERRLARSIYFFATTASPREYRGTTQSLASVAILDELKRTGRANVVLLLPEITETPYRGTLERVGTATESFPLLLDGARVTVQGVRAHGIMTGEDQADFNVLILDDPEAPWVLETTVNRGQGTRGGRRLLVRIATQSRRPAVENALDKKCVTSVHDIYFASGSDEIDSTSAPALENIAQVLRQHADWRLTLVGHTDSIGTAPNNLDLSRRRAERVRSALVSQYKIGGDRLRADGKGETAPVDDNGTLLGRARNRRVDLERSCPQQNKK